MSIKKIEVSNFKSFDNLSIELDDFNVLIGANASGKSNFVSIFKFLKDLDNFGLSNAISMQGGAKYLRNRAFDPDKSCSINVTSKYDDRFFLIEKEDFIIGINVDEITHQVIFEFQKSGDNCEISQINITNKCYFYKLENDEDKPDKERNGLGKGELILEYSKSDLNYTVNIPKNVPVNGDSFLIPPLKEQKDIFRTMLKRRPLFNPFFPFPELYNDIGIYDFDPKLPKNAIQITGKMELEENGSNLAIVLKNINENKEQNKKFSYLINDLLPFVEDINIQELADKSLMFSIKESYLENQLMPSFLISDGTINIAAIITALFFEKEPIAIIEEPERNIHPQLISKVVDMFKEASEHKQIIVTTHNPVLVKHAGIENILLISRDNDGFSKIVKPDKIEKIKTFLNNEIGLDELYIQDLLEV